VQDAAIILAVIAGPDARDEATREIPEELRLDFAAQLAPNALQGARLGIMREALAVNPRVQGILDEAIIALRAAGAEVIDPIAPPDLDAISTVEWEVLCFEFKAGVNAWFATLGPDAPVRSLSDLIRFNEAHAAQELVFYGQEILVTAEACGPLTEEKYVAARDRARRLARDEGIDRIMNEHQLDAIVVLTAGPAWLIDHVNGDTLTGESSTLAAVAGYPSITVPAGFDFGLPVGISFVGRAWSEGRLLALAADFEAKANARRPPAFLPTVIVPP
jgi:amidase